MIPHIVSIEKIGARKYEIYYDIYDEDEAEKKVQREAKE